MRIEAAVTTIVDCEDSVAAVDTEDKVLVYRNWAGLMRGDLTANIIRGKEAIERSLNPDLEFVAHIGLPALYATDIILEVEGCKKTSRYNPVRGQQVIR